MKINTTKNITDEVIEIELEVVKRPYPYEIKKYNVSKEDLQTRIEKERLHAAQPWNKIRPKGGK